jgi:FtsZ-interacting cell division protein ZipA
MSGGRRIDDHGFWAGSKGKASVFPDGPHKEKDESSAEGAGHLAYYEDTTEAIKKVQMAAEKKTKARPMGPAEFH